MRWLGFRLFSTYFWTKSSEGFFHLNRKVSTYRKKKKRHWKTNLTEAVSNPWPTDHQSHTYQSDHAGQLTETRWYVLLIARLYMVHVPTPALGKRMHTAMDKGKKKLIGKAQINAYPGISLLLAPGLADTGLIFSSPYWPRLRLSQCVGLGNIGWYQLGLS